MTLCFRYEVEAVCRGFGFESPLAAAEVDPDVTGAGVLREALQEWAVARLRENGCEFGLYAADFSAWHDDGSQEYYVRVLYIVWSGDDVLALHVDDNARKVELPA